MSKFWLCIIWGGFCGFIFTTHFFIGMSILLIGVILINSIKTDNE